jgi:hypothetical protein
MGFELMNFSSDIVEQKAVSEIMSCNTLTEPFGLVLTQEQAIRLAKTRASSLKANGRIEFGGGVIERIIFEFCDSPYIDMTSYADTLNELAEIFYYYKNETLDLISDDDLICFMKNAFDKVCHGSLEMLAGRELPKLVHEIRFSKCEHEEDAEDAEDEGGEDDLYE